MPARRKAAAVVAVGLAPLALTALAAGSASAHGSMGAPVSRGAQCYAEGPESPKSAACRAAVAAGGTQALYDWNGIRIGDAGGRHTHAVSRDRWGGGPGARGRRPVRLGPPPGDGQRARPLTKDSGACPAAQVGQAPASSPAIS